MELSINDLSSVLTAVFKASTKWYNIGLVLKVAIPTLERIGSQFDDPTDRLREMLKTWIETATKPTWQNIVNAVTHITVSEPNLASDIETRYCTRAETGQASGQTIPEGQRTSGTELQTLRQALQDSQELLQTKDQQLQDSQRRTHKLQQELQTKDQQLQDSQRRTHTLQQELQTKDQQLQDSQRRAHTLQQELQDSQRQIQQLTHQVEEKQHTIDDKETLLRELNQQLQSNEQVTAEFQRNLLQHEQANKQLQDTVGQLRRDLQHAMGPLPQKTVIQQKAIRDITWHKVSKAPEKMYRGSAAADSNMVYFNSEGSTTVHSYYSNTWEWHQLPDTPHTHSTLVVVHHVLTMVGGQISGEATDSLLSLMGEGRDIKWLPNLPAMPTKRFYTAAVCSGHSLIVAGGEDGCNILDTAEVLDTDTWQWSIASSLTHPFSEATVSICGERLYMLGGYDQTDTTTRSVLSCSVPELLQSCQPQPLAGKLRTAPVNQSTIWRCVADAPHYLSSCATLCGQLVAVGGIDEALKTTSAITGYNETTDSWEAMGDMPTAQCLALVAILDGKMMVVGGMVGGWTATDVVEILC